MEIYKEDGKKKGCFSEPNKIETLNYTAHTLLWEYQI